MPKVTLIVPCYNEAEVLPLFYKETKRVVDENGIDYELLFVNDGSKDATLEEMQELAKKDDKVKYLSFSRNFGKEAAMYAGLCNATGEMVAIMDADLQDPPALLPEMIRLIEGGEYDSVATRRENREGEPVVRSWFSKKFYKLINAISDADVVDGARDFRLMKRDMVDSIVRMSEQNRFSKGIFGWVGFKTYWLPYKNVERAAGTTKWSFTKLTSYAIDGIINFSEVPLDISSWMGIGLTIIALSALLIVFVRRLLFGDPVSGWASLMCVILFIGGVQLFCIGIMGKYIGKIYMETKRRPHYIIAQTNIEEPVLDK